MIKQTKQLKPSAPADALRIVRGGMRAIFTRFYGPTNRRGARIKASDPLGPHSVTVSYDYGARNAHEVAARALCEKLGWTGTLVSGGAPGGEVFVFVPVAELCGEGDV